MYKPFGVVTLVLIDTWWNVNALCRYQIRQIRSVLIDTWWNVNFLMYKPFGVVTLVLIDTWWNVNESFIIEAFA